MEFKNKLMIVSYFFLLVLVTQIPNIKSQGFSYVNGAANGPQNWGLLRPEWGICNTGQRQSPIDISDRRVVAGAELGLLWRIYELSPATLVNNGYDITLRWGANGAGSFWIDGTQYVLRQLHWHSPSEHTLNNERFPLELHMVHVSSDGRIAVIGILYRIGLPDLFLLPLERNIRAIQGRTGATEPVGLVWPALVDLGSLFYYRYDGSLTTPPCSEGVTWTVVSKVRTVSNDQVNLLRNAIEVGNRENARPLQQDFGRTVRFFGL